MMRSAMKKGQRDVQDKMLDDELKLLLVCNFFAVYACYLVTYRWAGMVSDRFVPHIFTTSNLLFSIWFVIFLVGYLLSLRKLIHYIRHVKKPFKRR